MRNLYQDVSDRILSQLEAGTVPWVKPWSATAGNNVPCNASTNRPYSGCNVILLWLAQSAGYASPRFLTFKQALELGGNVRKGEHGFKVYFVRQLTFKDTKATTDGARSTTEGAADDEIRTATMLREYTVFNVAQCENLPTRAFGGAAPKVRNSDERDATADEFLSHTQADIKEGHGEAYYAPGADFISMPAFGAFKSGATFYATMFHELAHWTGHKSRLDRDLRHRFGTQAYAAEELVAELTAAFMCAEFSINGDVRHAAYIANWIALLKSDAKAFFTACARAQNAADYLRKLALADAPVVELAA
jgi:antirestriction protein ArdC